MNRIVVICRLSNGLSGRRFVSESKKNMSSILEFCLIDKNANLKLKNAKCNFFKEEINYFGHIVSKDGILPDKKVSVIQNLKTLTIVLLV